MCDGSFYPAHKLVLSTCSQYFEQIFERAQCKHLFVVLDDIKPGDLEALLTYMYEGSVNVLQEQLCSVIEAAEYLRLKGLGVSASEPIENIQLSGVKNRRPTMQEDRPEAKRKKSCVEPAANDVTSEDISSELHQSPADEGPVRSPQKIEQTDCICDIVGQLDDNQGSSNEVSLLNRCNSM